MLYETSRLFPSVTVIPKKAARDTTLPYFSLSEDGQVEEDRRVVVKEGTEVYIDTTGLHANRSSPTPSLSPSPCAPALTKKRGVFWTAQYWEDPLEFRPERFLASYDKDAFVPFSAGPRVRPLSPSPFSLSPFFPTFGSGADGKSRAGWVGLCWEEVRRGFNGGDHFAAGEEL